MSNPNDLTLYRLEVDYSDDMYNDVFVYAKNTDEAVDYVCSDDMQGADVREVQVYTISDISNLNEEHLNRLLVFSMTKQHNFFTQVLGTFQIKQWTPNLVTLSEAIRLQHTAGFETILHLHSLETLRVDTQNHLAHQLGMHGSRAMIETFVLEWLSSENQAPLHPLFVGAVQKQRYNLVHTIGHHFDAAKLLNTYLQTTNSPQKHVECEVLEEFLRHAQHRRIAQQVEGNHAVKSKKI